VALKRSSNVIAFPAMKRKNTNVAKIDLTEARLPRSDGQKDSIVSYCVRTYINVAEMNLTEARLPRSDGQKDNSVVSYCVRI
jgi:hypothetical protein